MRTAKYLFLDLETTGLHPGHDDILECAWIITDGSLREIRRGQMVLHFRRIFPEAVDPFVTEMHTKNGLWAECETSVNDLCDLADVLAGQINSTEWVETRPILAGATVHFDRSFLRHWVPDVERLLHHRHLDVSSLKMALRDVDPNLPKPASSAAHRAMDDIEYSLGEARNIYALLADVVIDQAIEAGALAAAQVTGDFGVILALTER